MDDARKRVWLSPCPGVGFRAVIVRRIAFFVKVLYRDLDGPCRVEWGPDYGDLSWWLIDRDLSPQSSTGGAEKS